MRNKIQIAFDLGSYSIKSAVGRILPDGKIEILSIAEIQSDSIDCGDIIDKDLLLSHLEILIEKMEKDAKINIDEDAWVSVSGEELSPSIHLLELDQGKIQILKLTTRLNKNFLTNVLTYKFLQTGMFCIILNKDIT